MLPSLSADILNLLYFFQELAFAVGGVNPIEQDERS